MLKIILENKELEIPDGILYHDLAVDYEKKTGKKPYLVKANGIVKELRRHVKDREEISFLYYDSDAVKEVYARTAIFIMLKTIYDVYDKKKDGGLKFRVHNAYYFEMEDESITEDIVEKIRKEYQKNVESDYFIRKRSYQKQDALQVFKEKKMVDVGLLFKYNYRPVINLRDIDGYVKYINGALLYSTGYIKNYEIKLHHKGLLLILPNNQAEEKVNYREPAEKLFNIHNISVNWAKKLKINTVGKLNEQIADNHMNDLITMTESFQDKQIGDIAEAIAKSGKQLVFIAGPSSSGKTSFAHRLMYHLRAIELTPHPLSCDDFFKERSENPKKPNGEYDFETIDAVDIKLLNDTFNSLLKGEEVKIPKFNFALGEKSFEKTLKIEKNDIVILEGIHCLNPNLIPELNIDNVFRIYVSALTEVCIDNANRIATSDLRLMRRIVRDSLLRGTNPRQTLVRWKDVRAGEEKYIFPYQEEADIFFNSALIYEFSALKLKALPMLYKLAEDEEVGETAKRLIKTLNYFLSIDTENIPKYSLVREFIGGSSLNVG